MKCVYFYVLALTLAFPRDVRHVCPVVESVTSWGARCTRRVRVVPDVPSTLNKRKRARELLSQHIFGHNTNKLTMHKVAIEIMLDKQAGNEILYVDVLVVIVITL